LHILPPCLEIPYLQPYILRFAFFEFLLSFTFYRTWLKILHLLLAL
jgi:hypothetical protein